MLVLVREVGQEVVVNHNVLVKVMEVRNNKVYLGFEADRSIPVDRKEVHDRRLAEADQAAADAAARAVIERAAGEVS